ncbi:MAG: DUF4169 family protein [Hyphomicrobium sp.]|mgnify:FL=1|nr:DUF4169 family protein [Hyphomicrobium sp.]
MTAEIINLNKVRKAKERAEKERLAEENRIRHGRTKAEREQQDAQRTIDEAHLEGSRREVAGDGYKRSGETEEDLDPGSVS